MVDEARLGATDSGRTPASDGWFVLNVRDAAWLTNKAFGARCVFEANRRVLHGRPDLDVHTFPEVGFTIDVIEPGPSSGLYHAEPEQESFLIRGGECVLLV